MECDILVGPPEVGKFDITIEDAHAYSGYELDGALVSFRRDTQIWNTSLDGYLDVATMTGTMIVTGVPLPSGVERSPQASLDGWLVLGSAIGQISVQCSMSFLD